jgi:hypothetical protein
MNQAKRTKDARRLCHRGSITNQGYKEYTTMVPATIRNTADVSSFGRVSQVLEANGLSAGA